MNRFAQALQLYTKEEVTEMLEEEERTRRFANVDSGNEKLYSGVMTAVKLKRWVYAVARLLSCANSFHVDP